MLEKLKQSVKSSRDKIGDFLSSLENIKICEVGIRYGDHFRSMLTASVIEAVAVDPWRLFESKDCDPEAPYNQNDLDAQHDSFKELYKNDNRVIIQRMTSLEAAVKYPNNYFDFIYIDGNHKYEHCKNDLNAWWSKVKIGGFIAGHDYINVRDFGVIQAVTEFMSEKSINQENIYINEEQYASYYILRNQ